MRGVIYTLIGGISWAMSGAASQYLFQNNDANPDFLTVCRLLGAGVILLAASGKAPKMTIWKDPASVGQLILFALLGLTLSQYAYLVTISYTDAGTATVLQYTAPAMILAFVCIKTRRRPTLKEAIAITFALLGVFLIATNGDVTSLNMSTRGLMWGILAALGLAGYSLLPTKLQLKHSTLVVAGWAMLIGGAVMLIATQPWRHMMVFDLPGVIALIVLVLVGTALAFGIYLVGMKMIGAVKASMISSVEPVAAALMASLWLGTQFSTWDIIGFALVITTVLMLAFDGPRMRRLPYRRKPKN